MENTLEISIDQQKLNKKIEDLKEVFSSFEVNRFHNKVSLLAGLPGISIFLYQLFRFTKDDKWKEMADNALERAFESVENDMVINTFCNGLSGLAWSINYLENQSLIDYSAAELFEDIEGLIQQKSLSELNNFEYDFMHAGSGPAIYFIERENASPYLEGVVEALNATAEKGDFGVRWAHDYHRRLKGIQEVHCEYNFGLSHGMPSIISILCLIHEKGIKQELCEELILGCVKYIASNKLSGDFHSLYPSGEYENKAENGSRLAWCYGDLGIGLTFWRVYKTLGNAECKDLAMEIFTHAADRTDIRKNAIKDAGMCHGSAGLAHIFYRMWLETKDEKIKQAADYWLDVTLKIDIHEEGLAGYCAVHLDEKVNDYGFLEGIAGVGLALLTRAMDDQNPDWDRMLLIS